MSKPQSNISVKNLSIGYAAKTVSDNINFDVAQGELCAIIGVNGIGKSTLLRTLGNLQPLIQGELKIQGTALKDYDHNGLAQKISLVLTEPLASKNLTVLEVIALGRQPYTNWIGSLSHEDKRKVAHSLATLELDEFKLRKCHELSDGQLQRVLIARAMAQDTPLILLDEPTTHLDLYHKVQILKLLKTLVQNHQKSIVFTTHEIDLAIQLCDKILILDNKENSFGQPCELIAQGAFTRLFPNDMVRFDAKTGAFKVNKDPN
ncbi:ABC transporter ATP-binding protein [uncultured Croceitalea sp.]|uniref:ABC transporter ATP-binding protein n=1 Tax=uncultured Croceitalea sp. TaxID=1798908 RepID=UPI0033062509